MLKGHPGPGLERERSDGKREEEAGAGPQVEVMGDGPPPGRVPGLPSTGDHGGPHTRAVPWGCGEGNFWRAHVVAQKIKVYNLAWGKKHIK